MCMSAPPAAPVSSMLLGRAPTAFNGIIAVIAASIVTGTILVLSKKRSSAKPPKRTLLLPGTHFLVDHVSMHWESVLFKHLQLALDPVLRTYCRAGPHVLFDCRQCHSPDNIVVPVISLSLKGFPHVERDFRI